jgi:hypothetical protein
METVLNTLFSGSGLVTASSFCHTHSKLRSMFEHTLLVEKYATIFISEKINWAKLQWKRQK